MSKPTTLILPTELLVSSLSLEKVFNLKGGQLEEILISNGEKIPESVPGKVCKKNLLIREVIKMLHSASLFNDQDATIVDRDDFSRYILMGRHLLQREWGYRYTRCGKFPETYEMITDILDFDKEEPIENVVGLKSDGILDDLEHLLFVYIDPRLLPPVEDKELLDRIHSNRVGLDGSEHHFGTTATRSRLMCKKIKPHMVRENGTYWLKCEGPLKNAFSDEFSRLKKYELDLDNSGILRSFIKSSDFGRLLRSDMEEYQEEINPTLNSVVCHNNLVALNNAGVIIAGLAREDPEWFIASTRKQIYRKAFASDLMVSAIGNSYTQTIKIIFDSLKQFGM